jgi:hypothetical protein
MLERLALVTGLTLLLGLTFTPAARADTRFSLHVGVAPGPGYVWQDGYYTRRGFSHVWVPGRWVFAP